MTAWFGREDLAEMATAAESLAVAAIDRLAVDRLATTGSRKSAVEDAVAWAHRTTLDELEGWPTEESVQGWVDQAVAAGREICSRKRELQSEKEI